MAHFAWIEYIEKCHQNIELDRGRGKCHQSLALCLVSWDAQFNGGIFCFPNSKHRDTQNPGIFDICGTLVLIL